MQNKAAVCWRVHALASARSVRVVALADCPKWAVYLDTMELKRASLATQGLRRAIIQL